MIKPLDVCLESFSTDPPVFTCPGLYIFLSSDGDPLYVGQSGDILTRVGQHRRTKAWAKTAEVRYLPLTGGADARLTAETLMILRHRPRHNRAIKIGLKNDGELFEIQFIRGKSNT